MAGYWFAAIGAVAFGVLFATVGIRTAVNNRHRHRSWLPLTGVVTGSEWATAGGDLIAPTVAYTAPDGREHHFVNRYSSNATIVHPGRPVAILVNPANFDDAVMVGMLKGGGCAAVAFTAVGAVAIVGGCVGAYFLLKR